MNTQLEELFKEWKENVDYYNENIVKDGIINEELYDKSSVKVLFIAKEPNDPKRSSWSFQDLWETEEGFRNSFSFRIAEWAAGIQNNFKSNYDNLWEDYENMFNYLKSIAFINVKKIGGAGITNYDELHEHFNLNKNFLKSEIKIIKPEVIILGLSFDKIIREELFVGSVWKSSGYQIEISNWNGIKIIDFYHPSSRNAPAAAYSLLQNVFNSIEFKSL